MSYVLKVGSDLMRTAGLEPALEQADVSIRLKRSVVSNGLLALGGVVAHSNSSSIRRATPQG